MTLEEAVLQTLRKLSPDKQQEVLDFAQYLKQKSASKQPRRSLKGLCADLNIKITEEDIAGIRKEMWDSFPRELPI